MADTNVATGLTVQQWDDKFFTEYLTENRFAGEFGTSENSIIQVKEDLTKKKGDRVHYALVNKLTNSAITGSSVLEGNEESMDSRSFPVTVDKRRNGVRVAEIDEQYSAIGLRTAAKSVLKDWSMKDTEELVLKALSSINGTAFGDADDTARDAWLVDNADRVLFGATRSGNAANDFSANLTSVSIAADTFTAAALSKMKRIALTIANPKIRPIRTSANGRHYYVAYADSRAFNDLKGDTTITQAQREVALEMENNRLFQGGDLLWDGVIVKEIHEGDADNGWYLADVGDGGTVDVARVALCGAQAIGAAYARRWRSREETFDYGDKQGVAIDSIYGIEKLRFGSGVGDTDDYKDHGVVTGFFATAGLT